MRNTARRFTIILLFISVFAYADIIYVDNNISDGFWQGSYSSLQNALASAQSGDEIWVAQGTYTPGINRGDSFILKEGVKLYGGFYGGESSLQDRDVHSNKSILSGDIGISGNSSDNVYHVISYSGTLTNTSVVDGFIIRDGNADDGNGGGGLLLKNGAEPIFKNCHFYLNQSSDGGGAVSLENGASFRNCLFESNSAGMGAAIFSLENRAQIGEASFDLCTFVGNISVDGSAFYFEKRESAHIDSSVFWNNTDGSGNVNSLSLETKVSSSSVTNSAFDDVSITAVSISNIIYYSSNDADGPFLNVIDYHLDNEHGIPREYGWYYVPAPLVLNIRVFLEGAF
ncbi:MAG: DUF1565 domain-containing protein [Candidatus Marinimicrobia bacterium]|nr:DUF1565 domain-containing protein [Candidatus Neomarinimicrobiota bacterium]